MSDLKLPTNPKTALYQIFVIQVVSDRSPAICTNFVAALDPVVLPVVETWAAHANRRHTLSIAYDKRDAKVTTPSILGSDGKPLPLASVDLEGDRPYYVFKYGPPILGLDLVSTVLGTLGETYGNHGYVERKVLDLRVETLGWFHENPPTPTLDSETDDE